MPPKWLQRVKTDGKVNGTATAKPPAPVQPPAPAPPLAPKPEFQPRPMRIQPHYYQEPDPRVAAEMVRDMTRSLAALKGAHFSFQGRSTTASDLQPLPTIATEIRTLRNQSIRLDLAHERGIKEVTNTLQNEFTNEVVGQLRYNLEYMIRDEVSKRIKEKVRLALERQFPKELAEKIALHQKQLKAIKLALHNSEARRANATIRSNDMEEPLTPLEMEGGHVSEVFPPTPAHFFAMSEPVCQRLLKEYGLPFGDGEPREAIMNRILAFIGVTFQIVPGPGGATLTV